MKQCDNEISPQSASCHYIVTGHKCQPKIGSAITLVQKSGISRKSHRKTVTILGKKGKHKMFTKEFRLIVAAAVLTVAVFVVLWTTPVASAQAPVDPCSSLTATSTLADVIACQQAVSQKLNSIEALLKLLVAATSPITTTNPVTSTTQVTTTAPVTVPKSVIANPDCGGGLGAFTIPQGQVKLVKQGCQISGDVEIGTTEQGPFDRLYDDDANTGVVVTMLADGYVYAPYGASVNTDSVETWKNNMMASGCLGHCLVVYELTWPAK